MNTSIQIAPLQGERPKMSMTSTNFSKPVQTLTPLSAGLEGNPVVREESLGRTSKEFSKPIVEMPKLKLK